MSKCECYRTQTERRYLSNIEKITYTVATETLAPEYIDEEVSVCYGTKEKDVCSCGGDKTKCCFYEHVRAEAAEEKNLLTAKNVLEEIENI